MIRQRKILVLVAVALLTLAGVWMVGPIAQPPQYHAFVDTRELLGIPNFGNVISNLPFFLLGLAGLVQGLRGPRVPGSRAWRSVFLGSTLVALGSGWYHLQPDNETLVWDRLAIVVALMGMFAAVLEEYVDPRASALFWPAILLGVVSVAWWSISGDLRLYVWVQGAALLLTVGILTAFESSFGDRRFLYAGLGLYALAKVAEFSDERLYVLTQGIVSGHTLKHLLAAAGIAAVYLMLKRRVDIRYGEKVRASA